MSLGQIIDSLEEVVEDLRDLQDKPDGSPEYEDRDRSPRRNPGHQKDATNSDKPPTEKQLQFLENLQYVGYMPQTRAEASRLIERCLEEGRR